MNLTNCWKDTLSRGAIVLVIASAVSYWSTSVTVLGRLAETDHPRIRSLLGHEDWLNEQGMFAVPPRDQLIWGLGLLVLAAYKTTVSYRTGQSDMQADTICALLGMSVGIVLAFLSHALTYGFDVVFQWAYIVPGAIFSLLGNLVGLLVGGIGFAAARVGRAGRES